jgi:hypothetical protein
MCRIKRIQKNPLTHAKIQLVPLETLVYLVVPHHYNYPSIFFPLPLHALYL